jgi:hypothetical protein
MQYFVCVADNTNYTAPSPEWFLYGGDGHEEVVRLSAGIGFVTRGSKRLPNY